MTRRFRSPTDPVERAGVPPEDPEGRVWARPAPLAWTGRGPAAMDMTEVEMNATLSGPGMVPVAVDGIAVLGRSAAATHSSTFPVELGRVTASDRSAAAHLTTFLVARERRAAAAAPNLASPVGRVGRATASNRPAGVAPNLPSPTPLDGQVTALDRSAAATHDQTSPATGDFAPAHPAPPHQPTQTFAPTPPRAYAAPALTGGTPRTQRNRVVALAGYPQRICGQLGGLWITQGHRGGNPVADRMTPAHAGRGEWA